MAKTISPYFSISAKGKLGNILTFFKHSGQNHIISKRSRRGLFVQPFSGLGLIYLGGSFLGYSGRFSKTTKKQEQGAQRVVFQNAWIAYSLLTEYEKNVLKNEAKNLKMTGANLFMSRYYKS